MIDRPVLALRLLPLGSIGQIIRVHGSEARGKIIARSGVIS